MDKKFKIGDIVKHYRNEGKATVLGHRANGSVIVEYSNGVMTWAPENSFDFAPKKREGWINIYKDDEWSSRIHPSQEHADLAESGERCRVACVKIEWEE